MKRVLMFCLFLGVAVTAFSQEPTTVRRSHVVQDERVEEVVRAHRQLNQRSGINGFRVQIYTDSGNRSKLRTDRVKAEFDARYPRLRSYITYDEPYYRLRVGDFRSRLDAQRFLNEIQGLYPAAHIVTDRIQFPRLEGENPPPD